ncbi:hypothetical protein LINPERPRIM_LOCUS31627 [Linum perenne]
MDNCEHIDLGFTRPHYT